MPVTYTVSGVVFHDRHFTGHQDGDDEGLAGRTVTLTQLQVGSYVPLGQATTQADGSYRFGVPQDVRIVPDGVFRVGCDPPAGWGATTAAVVDAVCTVSAPDVVAPFGEAPERELHKECVRPASSWVHEVCWDPGPPWVAVTYKDRHGTPYFRCGYPGTTYDDYRQFIAQVSFGKWVWYGAPLYYYRPYVPLPLGS